MPAILPDVATPDTTLCGRCGAVLEPGGDGAVTCQTCLGSDLAQDLAEWFAVSEIPAGQGLRAAGGFTLLEEIGQGGMGQVFRARQESPDREVAVKLLMPHLSGSEETRRRFLAEAEAMAELEHPGLLPLYACGETDGRPWLVTRLAAGGNLAQRRQQYTGRWRAIAELVAGLADAIQHAHARGIIHRDLKPSNILFASEGAACIADFGLAKWRDDQTGGQTLSHAMMGTPAYMAPELAKNGARTATTAADVYGLGAILYELLTGRAPHTGRSPAEILVSLTGADPPRPRTLQTEIPRDLEVICLHAISREPAGRYATAAALGVDLKRFLAGQTILARPYSPLEKLVRWTRRRPLAASLTGLLGAVLVTSGVIIVAKNAELRRMESAWRTAADDAEGRVIYATVTLPEKLAPFGRLKLLDGIFEDVAKFYDRPRLIPENERAAFEVRKAAFLARWGRVLLLQGRIQGGDGAKVKLQEAEEICARVTSRPDAPADAWAARSTERLFSGFLARRNEPPPNETGDKSSGTDRGTRTAKECFTEAIAAADEGLKRYPKNPDLLAARAEAMTERCDLLIAGEGGELEALNALESAWKAAVDAVKDSPSRHQKYARTLIYVHYFRGLAAGKRRDWRGAEAHYRKLLAETDQQASLPEDQFWVAVACGRVAGGVIDASEKPLSTETAAEVQRYVARQRRIVDDLMAADSQNLRWKTEAAIARLQEAWPAILDEDHLRAIPLLEEAAGLIRNVPPEVHTGLETARSSILIALARQLRQQTTELVRKAKPRPGEEIAPEDRQAALEAADATFAVSLEAFPFARDEHIPQKDIPQTAIEYSWRTWHKYALEADYARKRLVNARDNPAVSPNLKAFLVSQLGKLSALESKSLEPPRHDADPDHP